MEKTAKITRTVFKNEWNNPKGGSVFYHDIELDNGDKGSIGAKDKEPSKLNPGQEITYTIESGEKGNKIKAVNTNANGFNGAKKQPANNSSFALAYSKDILIASWSEHSPKKLSSEDMFKLADKMHEWMEGKK
jgi:hypothetical protein